MFVDTFEESRVNWLYLFLGYICQYFCVFMPKLEEGLTLFTPFYLGFDVSLGEISHFVICNVAYFEGNDKGRNRHVGRGHESCSCTFGGFEIEERRLF